MGIGSITSANSMTGMQTILTVSTDPKIKNIQNEITDAKQQMQKLSSKEELPANEKANERKKLQKEISDLTAELKQYQADLQRSQKRENLSAKLQEDQNPTKEEKSENQRQAVQTLSDRSDESRQPISSQQAALQETVISSSRDGTVILKSGTDPARNRGTDTDTRMTDETREEAVAETDAKPIDRAVAADTGLSHKDMRAMVSADSSVQQADRQGTVIARTRDGIAILKGEMKLDELRGADTEKKQKELEKMEQKETRATAFQFSVLGEANNAMKTTAKTDGTGSMDWSRVNAGNNAFTNAMKKKNLSVNVSMISAAEEVLKIL